MHYVDDLYRIIMNHDNYRYAATGDVVTFFTFMPKNVVGG